MNVRRTRVNTVLVKIRLPNLFATVMPVIQGPHARSTLMNVRRNHAKMAARVPAASIRITVLVRRNTQVLSYIVI